MVQYDSREITRTLPVISFTDLAACVMPAREFTLKHAGRTMRLIFNLDVDQRAYVIDSLPFQNGTFQLDQKGLLNTYRERIIPAKRWKKISS